MEYVNQLFISQERHNLPSVKWMGDEQIIYVKMWVKIICPPSIRFMVDDFNHFHDCFEEHPILQTSEASPADCHRAPTNSENINCFRQSPHLTQEASVSDLFFPITPVFHLSGILFVTRLMLTPFSYTNARTGSVGKGRKAFATHLLLVCLLEKTLLSQSRELLFG